MAFADVLKKLRKEAGLTQQELADKSGIYRESIARLETGDRGPSWDSIQILARALGVDITAFQEAMPKTPAKEKKPKKG